MKSFLKTVLLSAGCLLALAACKDSKPDSVDLLKRLDQAFAKAGETQGDGNPALWKMADEDTTIYLYGTFHILPETGKWQTSEMKTALETSDKLVMELDITVPGFDSEMARLQFQYALLEDGTKLSSLLTQEQHDELALALTELDINVDDVEEMQPWIIGLQIQIGMMIANGYNPAKGVESVMTEIANANGLEFSGLETAEQQIKFLASDSLERQIEALMLTVETRHKIPQMTDLLLAEWVDGDVQGLDALMGDPLLMGSQEMYDVIIKNRNQAWIPLIEELLEEPGSKFIAVGAAHLAGPDSVITMLENKGHKVEVLQ